MSLVPVRFLVSDGPYNAGEIAGFPAKKAQLLVQRKVARLYVPASGASAATASLVSGVEVKEADVTQPSLEPAIIAAEERKRLPEPVAPSAEGEEVPTSEAAIVEGKIAKRKRR